MSIRRTRLAFERNYTQTPNAWLRDKRLSRRARGLLAELLSHREGWRITIESLVQTGPEGRDAIRSAIAELVEYGYLTVTRERGERGRLAGTLYELADPSESPASDFPTQAEPTEAEPPHKKTMYPEDQSGEHHLKPTLPRGRDGGGSKPASRDQRDYLLDIASVLPDSDAEHEARRADLTGGEASALIDDLWPEVEHALQTGGYNDADLTPRMRVLAARRAS